MELLDTRKRRAGLRPVRLFLECQHNTIRKHKDGAPWCSTSVNFGGRKRARTADLLRVNYDDNFSRLLVHCKKWLYYYVF